MMGKLLQEPAPPCMGPSPAVWGQAAFSVHLKRAGLPRTSTQWEPFKLVVTLTFEAFLWSLPP